MLQLRVLGDDRLFLFVVLGGEGGDGVRRLRDGRLERGGFPGKVQERIALGLNAAAQILDLALGFENASSFFVAARRDTRCGPRKTSPSRVTTATASGRSP